MRRLHALLVAVAAVASLACIWDRDTIDDELRGVPDAFDLIVGHWPQHSVAYYEARIEQIPPLLAETPGRLDLYDDLAVAYERLERYDDAIAIMHDKSRALDGVDDDEQRYRMHANLGTFYAHDGQYALAVAELEQALQINPDAHFGRERLQIDAVRYVAAAQSDASLWSSTNYLTWSGYPLLLTTARGGLPYPREARDESAPTLSMSTDDMIEGTAGMIRFGGRDAAELYRTLGDIYVARGDLNLAWWAYQRAKERQHPAADRVDAAIAAVEAHWASAGFRHAPDASDYAAVRAWVGDWRAAFDVAERQALTDGLDPSDPAVLSALVAQADSAVSPMPRVGPTLVARALGWPPLPLVAGVLAVLGALMSYATWRMRSAAATLAAEARP